MKPSKNINFVILAILDGWGIAPDSPGNAITRSDTPNFKKYWISYPHTQLKASGNAVGLPKNENGNTETGHLNLGAGRIVYQDLERINRSISEGNFLNNQIFIESVLHTKKYNSNMHLLGLIGEGCVHSSIDHLKALINFAKENKVENLFLHLFTDGRDSPPKSAIKYIKEIENMLKQVNLGYVATLMGRYWAMDRDQRWDRTQKAYQCLTQSKGINGKSAIDIINDSYKKNITDEFIEPSCVLNQDSKPIARISDNDTVIFFNFRIDRPRQLAKAFIFNDFSKAPINLDYSMSDNNSKVKTKEPFKRGKVPHNLFFVTMTNYSNAITKEGAHVAFPPETIDMPLGRVISLAYMRQLRITESEKERFVTFYINGLRDEPFPLEDRVIIPSPKVSTYDKAPEMSAESITSTLIKRMQVGDYKFAVVNYPNADMLGHTGNIQATIKGVEAIDREINKLANYVLSNNGVLIITADHGNAEEMINMETRSIDTEHSMFPVPFIAISTIFLNKSVILTSGILADIAPTVLSILGLNTPDNMTGRNLLSGLI